MKIELNRHFKPDECVLYCGEAVYATFQSREEPVTPEGYVRTWHIKVQRRGLNKEFYVTVKNGRARLTRIKRECTIFHTYKEAENIARLIMETGTVYYADVAERLQFEYEDDTYAT